MSEREADLVEFQRLRQEIDGRTPLAYGLVALEIAALGASISVVDRVPAALLGAAIISIFLWLFWMDHASQVHRIVAYIALVLAPRIRSDNPGAFTWEFFNRELEAGGSRSASALFGPATPVSSDHVLRKSGLSDWPIGLLFGGSPPLLLTAYAFLLNQDFLWLSVAGIIVAGSLWIYTCLRFRIFIRNLRTINRAISSRTPE